MSLRAEIAIIDDDENVVGIAKVPLYDSDVLPGIRGPFAENMVTDPDTGEVYKFTFQADVVGQIAPKHEEPDASGVKAGDNVRIIDSANRYGHGLKVGSEGKVRVVYHDGSALVDGVMENGAKVAQDVAPEDFIVLKPPFLGVGDVVRVIANTSRHHFDTGALVEVEKVYPNGTIAATGASSGRTITQTLFRDDYILE